MKKEIDSYGFVLKFIHWTTALLIMGLLFFGLVMTNLPFDDTKLKIYMLHKSFGLLVLMLVVVRVVWKFATPKVKALETHQRWEIFLAKLTHVLLYFIIFAMPLSGWIMSSAAEFPVSFFGLPVPALTAKDPNLFEYSRLFHELLALGLMGVLVLHLAGALKHHVIDRDRTMMRMMNSKNYNFFGALAVGLLFAGLLGTNIFIAISQTFAGSDAVAENVVHEQSSADTRIGEDVSLAGAQGKSAWLIAQDKSRLSFDATQYGQVFNGTFTFDGAIYFDPEVMEGNVVSISIDITSISTGSADRDSQALSGEWFDVEHFPKAQFEATRFEAVAANQYIAHGTLVIRDVGVPVDLPFSLNIQERDGVRVADVQAQTVLRRLEFGIGQGQWKSTEAIGDEVKIILSLTAYQTQENTAQ